MRMWTDRTIQARCAYLDSGDPTLQALEDVPENFEDAHHHAALSFQYCTDAYGVFLEGQDDFSQQDQFIEDRYGAFSVGKCALSISSLYCQHERTKVFYQRLIP